MRFNRITAMLFAFLIIISAALVSVCAAGAPTESDSVRVSEKMLARSFVTSSGVPLNYRLYRSPGYDVGVDTKPAMLIIYFHNESGKGDDNTTHLAERGLLNQLVSDSADAMFADYQYIVVAPQCPAGKSFADADMLTAVGELREELAATEILTKKCVVAGVGTGVSGALDFVSAYVDVVDRFVGVGGTPDKQRAFGVLSVGVTMNYFAESDNAAARAFYDYAETMGEGGSLDMVFTDGGMAESINAALNYNEPSVTEWMVKDAYESRRFNISARCTEGGGKISVSPAVPRYAENVSVLLTLNKGYLIDRLVVDGEDHDIAELEQSKTNKSQYTYNFMGVTMDHSIMVELRAERVSGDKDGLINGLITGLTVAAAVLVLAAAATFVISKRKV